MLRPEARDLSRRLGKRFDPASRATSTVAGTLTLEGNQQQITLVRSQTESGESVDLLLAGRRLTWTSAEGIRLISGVPTDTEQLLIERLIFDSPDQFVLAQLRGASYFTVAQNVRPIEAVDGYAGPAWTLVRVNDPQRNGDSRVTSRSRIYYINSLTGLIDRVVSELNRQTIMLQVTLRYGAIKQCRSRDPNFCVNAPQDPVAAASIANLNFAATGRRALSGASIDGGFQPQSLNNLLSFCRA